MIRLLRVTALALVLSAASALTLGAQTAADSAWDRGDIETAARLYAERLATDSADQRALHRMAVIHAWAERYDQSVALFDRLLALAPRNHEAAVDRARTLAWRGDVRGGIRAVEQVLAQRPDYLPALRALAQFASWAGEFDGAVRTYDQILEIVPEDRSARRDRARVLSWASQFDQAAEAYGRLLREDPADRDATLGLAQVLAWGGRFDTAAAVYRRILALEPENSDARRGLARTKAWSGDLRGAEREWRTLLAETPDDVPALVGLAQTLRWQERAAEGWALIARARSLAPEDADVRTEWSWTRSALSPRVAPAFLYEDDSEGNRIATGTLRASWHAFPRLEVSAESYFRAADVEGSPLPARESRGAVLGLRGTAPAGWRVSAAAGATRSDAPGAETEGAFRAAVSSPVGYAVGATVAYQRKALDLTALIIESRVQLEEWALTARAEPARRWTITGGVAEADYFGTASNERHGGFVGVARRVGRPWTFGLSGRAFGFERDLNDGYFDPDFYGIVEASGRWLRELGRWVVIGELAPGIQRFQLGGGDWRTGATVQGFGRLAYVPDPGREIGISVAFSSTGLQTFSTGDADYRYRAVAVSASWAF